MKRTPNINAAAAPADFRLTLEAGAESGFVLHAADTPGEEGAKKLRTFTMSAYTGGKLHLREFSYPVVADLSGMTIPKRARPILRAHDPLAIVGHTTEITNSGGALKLSGTISGANDHAREIAESADNGFPWEASIGAQATKLAFVDRGETVTVNGRTFTGPLYVARQSKLKEISFVALGGDEGGATATVHAGQTTSPPLSPPTLDHTMLSFTQWLQAQGFASEESLSEQAMTFLKAQHDRLAKEAEQEVQPPRKIQGAATGIEGVGETPTFDPSEIRAGYAAETQRVKSIHKILASYGDIMIEADGASVDLESHAITAGWTPDRVELEAMRHSRPKAPAGHVHGEEAATSRVLEAALALQLRLPEADKQYDAKTLEAADRGFRRVGLQQVLLICATANGYHCRPGERIHPGNIRDVLDHAMLRASANTTLSLPDIMSNVANKELLVGFMEEDQAWREVSRVATVTDFKDRKHIRLLDNLEYDELQPGGEIKHGELSEESYTSRAKTYAKMLTLTREDIINDDLGALDDLRNRIGRGAARKFNNVFWTRFLDNSGFYTTGRGNYKAGTATALNETGSGLEQGISLFRKLKSAEGKRIGGSPVLLVVPPELEFIADRLYTSEKLKGSTDSGDNNIHVNKYRPLVVHQLSDETFGGYSAKAWYLFRAPTILAPMVVSFLNGVQQPTVEQFDQTPDRLGVIFRGYFDVGADPAEYLAGVKLKGEN